jgi:isoleucyl-tRNA synthetase
MTDQKTNADFYKETVFLPKTDFPMRGELPKKEPEILKRWQEMDLYTALRQASKGKPKWVLHWGPPYANGDPHMGHAFTKALKDVVNRSWQMSGYDAPLVPGQDCHGLPIEWKIEQKYRAEGKNKDDVDPVAFRAECRAFARHWAEIQNTAFQRLGVCADWQNPYLTMTNAAEAQIVREIHKFLLNGLLYKGVKPVMWSTVEKTALADAEVEYREHKSITVWVKFPVTHTRHKPLENASVVIWTTTPWTLPSNRAIAFGNDIQYALYEVKAVAEDSKAKIGDRLLLAVKLADDVKSKAKIAEWDEEMTFKGSDLDGMVCAHPLKGQGYEFDVPLLAGDFVTEDTGTGFVHIAPAHGEDDFFLYLTHFGAKDIPDNVTDDGKYREHVPLFAGMVIYDDKGNMGDGNFAVLKAFELIGALLAKGSLKHEYPHSWRSKAPVIFRATPQWFIALDQPSTITSPPPAPSREGGPGGRASLVAQKESHPSPSNSPSREEAGGGEPNGEKTLRTRALAAIAATRWIPKQGENRIRAMIEQRPDWCVSRQRIWGVPIALFLDKDTGAVLKDEHVLNRIAEAFEAEGADAWWARDAQYFLGPDYSAGDYIQVFDTVDVWFDSACTHAFVLEQRPELKWPADLYLEGSDQHRGWFHTSLLESCGTRGRAPYDAVLTHGFVLDEKGYKMSKSLGNVVDPAEMIGQYGADIVRLWALLSDYNEDIRIGKDTIKNTSDLYRRIRNTFRFLLGALDGFTVEEKIDDIAAMPELERLVLHWLAEIDGEIREHIRNYQFNRIAHRLHNFCSTELSAFYFDIRKDSLYCDVPTDIKRRACRTVLSHVFECLVTWLAPMLAFTAEEAWSQRPANVFGEEQSVHLRTFPAIPTDWRNDALAAKWETARKVRRAVLGALEPKRADKTIGSSLEAAPQVFVTPDIVAQLKNIDLAELCITSQAELSIGEAPADAFRLNDVAGVGVVFHKAEGRKCLRSWKILPEVGTDKDYPDLTLRDADAVRWFAQQKKAA